MPRDQYEIITSTSQKCRKVVSGHDVLSMLENLDRLSWVRKFWWDMTEQNDSSFNNNWGGPELITQEASQQKESYRIELLELLR